MAGVFKLARRSISSSVARFAAAEAGAASNELRLNLCTPHKPMHLNKAIAGMVLPGEGHYFGVTAQVRQYAAQLKPGVVTIYHVGGEEEKFFVPGGFAFQGPDSVAEVSVPEAIPLADFDHDLVKKNYSDASARFASCADGTPEKAQGFVEVTTYAELARALGVN